MMDSQPIRVFAGTLAVLALAAVGYLSWQYADGLTVSGVAVYGADYAPEEDIVALAGIEQGAPLMDVSAVITADRVERHPWIASAGVSRLPTGEVSVKVLEREPVALYVDGDGRPSLYMDAEGYRMPFRAGDPYDVPIIRGSLPQASAVIPVDHRALRELLALLPDLEPELDALISEIHVTSSGLRIVTSQLPSGRTLSALVGDEDILGRLEKLHAFWHQAALHRNDTEFTTVDLRFAGQVITRERIN